MVNIYRRTELWIWIIQIKFAEGSHTRLNITPLSSCKDLKPFLCFWIQLYSCLIQIKDTTNWCTDNPKWILPLDMCVKFCQIDWKITYTQAVISNLLVTLKKSQHNWPGKLSRAALEKRIEKCYGLLLCLKWASWVRSSSSLPTLLDDIRYDRYAYAKCTGSTSYDMLVESDRYLCQKTSRSEELWLWPVCHYWMKSSWISLRYWQPPWEGKGGRSPWVLIGQINLYSSQSLWEKLLSSVLLLLHYKQNNRQRFQVC